MNESKISYMKNADYTFHFKTKFGYKCMIFLQTGSIERKGTYRSII